MKKAIWLVLGSLFFVGSVGAQDVPKAELSAGYSFFRAGFSGGVNQQGGSVSLAGNVNRWLGIVGDFGVYHASPYGSSLNTYTFQVGPRFSLRTHSRVTPFGQVLVGGSRLTASAGGSSGAITPFTVSAGGGVDVGLSRRLALRPQLEYLALRDNGSTLHCGRASLSLVFRFGGS
jgi:hypothetical protein